MKKPLSIAAIQKKRDVLFTNKAKLTPAQRAKHASSGGKRAQANTRAKLDAAEALYVSCCQLRRMIESRFQSDEMATFERLHLENAHESIAAAEQTGLGTRKEGK